MPAELLPCVKIFCELLTEVIAIAVPPSDPMCWPLAEAYELALMPGEFEP